ncbi:MAG: glycosyltransferase, partial [Prevotella sp.]|nr:glycosyltransferase [Prevotella sp.]
NDGCTDETEEFIADYLTDERITYIKNEENTGLGHALNQGLNAAKYDYIAYLPSDDYFEPDHLDVSRRKFASSPDAVLIYHSIRFDESTSPAVLAYRTCKGAIPGYCLQLVQVAHRKTADRWMEREECVTEDLFLMFWQKLTSRGLFVPSKMVTCEWTCHPHQRHKICGEQYDGGLNKYRSYYHVKRPLRFRCNHYKTIDEFVAYAAYRKPVSPSANGLKILLVGELAYNSERIYALEEAGHRLYGLWAKPRFCYSTVGPLPFGHVEDVPYRNWQERVREIAPDIIYGLLSTSAIELAHEVLSARLGIPFVWQFKEGPHEAMKAGMWKKLIDLYTYADGRMFLNPEIKKWYELFMPPSAGQNMSLVIDADMPKSESLTDAFSEKLSDTDGEVHTVVTGRIVGLSPEEFKVLSDNSIHLHVYSENMVSADEAFMPFMKINDKYFHIHRHCPQSRWVEEFSKYDAGWLHSVKSHNDGNLLRANWSDLNLPARINTLAFAGIPMIQRSNMGQINAQRSYVEKYGMGIFYNTIYGLVAQLKDKEFLRQTEENVRKHRGAFAFDSHIDELTAFFMDVRRKVYERQ